MENVDLKQKEEMITAQYMNFLTTVREAFNQHCDEIREKALKKFAEIPEDDQENRQHVLDEQKKELDQTLSELRQLLNKKGMEMSRELEEIANIRDQDGFNLDSQLAEV